MKINKRIKLMDENLSGREVISRLRKGHMLRREAWVDGYYIRICNETGYGEDGNCIFDICTSIYTLSTHGYFYHIGSSNQPLRRQYAYESSSGFIEIHSRCAEGLNGIFQDDWEDYGFISREDFDLLTKELKQTVAINIDEAKKIAISLKQKEIERMANTHET